MECSPGPWRLRPQQESAPELSPAQLWLAPTPRNEALKETGEGVLEGAMVPLPSCPAPLAPQHDSPEEVSAHVCNSPRPMTDCPLTPDTTVGASFGPMFVPSPTWPKSFRPQQKSCVAVAAQVCPLPAAMATARESGAPQRGVGPEGGAPLERS